jgi:hypothetical protein
MPRIPSKEIGKEIIEAVFWQWEFVRMNAGFRNACDRLPKAKNETEEAEKIRKKYGFYPCNYNLSKEDILRIVNADVHKKPSMTSDEFDATLFYISQNPFGAIVVEDGYSKDGLGRFLKDYKDIKYISSFPKKNDYRDICTLRLAINLQYPKKKLLYELERIIDLYQDKGAGGHGATRSDMYSSYSSIYYLRVFERKKYREIAVQVYPNDSYKDLDSAIQKVKRNFKVAQLIVNGGVRKIR